ACHSSPCFENFFQNRAGFRERPSPASVVPIAASRHHPIRRQTMKSLTTLTAVAALIAGISFAQAQGTMGSPSSGSSMQKSQTIGSSPFCINTSASGALNCKYASMAACEKDAKPQNLNCSPNPNKGTTGSRQ
ncbi:MAG: hypothetical protein WCA05_20505, partial [Pseudolabrys sp.]